MSSLLLRAVIRAYRQGTLPPRGYGRLFDWTPAWLWGGETVRVTTAAGPMQLPVDDHGARQLMIFGRLLHEVAETELLRAVAARISCSIDIGANVGWYTRILAAGGGRVLAFEPNPWIYPHLCANIREFELVESSSTAVGEIEGTTTFYAARRSDLSSSARQVGAPIEVDVTTLDDVVATRGIAPDLVKCDIEGGEVQVLRGARRLRSSADPPMWLIEADEEYLADQAMSYDTLEQEVNGTGGAIRKFWVDPDGHWAPLMRFSELRGTGRVNVLLVPEQRLDVVDGLIA